MEMSGQLHALATSRPEKKPPSTYWIGVWVDTTAGLDMVAKRKMFCPCQELNNSHPAHSLVTALTRYSGSKFQDFPY